MVLQRAVPLNGSDEISQTIPSSCLQLSFPDLALLELSLAMIISRGFTGSLSTPLTSSLESLITAQVARSFDVKRLSNCVVPSHLQHDACT